MRGGWILGPFIGAGMAIIAVYAIGEHRARGAIDDLLLYVKPDGRFYIAAKDAIYERLFDPYTAKFGKFWSSQVAGRLLICGTVNSKNRMGAYIGMQIFAYDTISHSLIFKDDVGERVRFKEDYDQCEKSQYELTADELKILQKISTSPKN